MKKDNRYTQHVIEIADIIERYPSIQEDVLVSELSGISKMPDSTILEWISVAREYNANRCLLMKIPKTEMSVVEVKKANVYNILTRDECLEVLSNIARGVHREIKDEIIIPTENDRIKAIQELMKYNNL